MSIGVHGNIRLLFPLERGVEVKVNAAAMASARARSCSLRDRGYALRHGLDPAQLRCLTLVAQRLVVLHHVETSTLSSQDPVQSVGATGARPSATNSSRNPTFSGSSRTVI